MRSQGATTDADRLREVGTVKEGLAYLRLRGLKFLCLAVLMTMPILIVRDTFVMGVSWQTPEAVTVFIIRVVLTAASAVLLRVMRTGRTLWAPPVMLALSYIVALVIMVLVTIVSLGGAESPVYAGLLTIMVGWCYFFPISLWVTGPLFVAVLASYVGTLGAFHMGDELTSGPVLIRAALLAACAALTLVASAAYLREQRGRFRAFIRQQEIAGHDPLTGSLNRNAVLSLFESAVDRASRHQRDVSCLMVDIDNFKQVNDSLGHVVGDRVIRFVTDFLKERVGARGHIARWGGEEFLVVLPAFRGGQALSLAEDLCDELADLIVPGTSPELKVTVSMGVATWDQVNDPRAGKRELIERADAALYQAKHNGKSQAVLYRPDIDAHVNSPPQAEPSRAVPQLSQSGYRAWLLDEATKGYLRFALWMGVLLLVLALGARAWVPGHEHLSGFSYTELTLGSFAYLSFSALITRQRFNVWLTLFFHAVAPIVVALTVSLLSLETGGGESPAFILVMAVMIVGSFTLPMGWRLGIPVFIAMSTVWPVVVLMDNPDVSLRGLVVRTTIIGVMGIVCSLAQNLFHRIRLQQVLVERHLDSISTTDSLTQAENRRSFERQLAHECNLALRQESELTVVLLDMNGLKQINDKWGHSVGDAALQRLADVVRQFIRSSDVFARLGGDEFALILPETNARGALSLAGRIHKQLDIEPVVLPRVPEFEVSATCGVAQLTFQSLDPTAARSILLRRADSALYAAKEAHDAQMGLAEADQITLVPLWSAGVQPQTVVSQTDDL